MNNKIHTTQEYIPIIDQFIGLKIRSLRLLHNFSREKLAIMINIMDLDLQEYEAGHNKITIDILDQIAKIFGKEISYFYDGLESLVEIPPLKQTRTESY